MLLVNLLLSFTTLTSFLLGMFIIVSNPRKPVNRALAAVLFGIFLWLFTNLLTNLSANPAQSLFFARTTLIGASILPYAFLLFCMIYTHQELGYRRAVQLAIVPLMLILTFPTKHNIVNVEAYGQKTTTGIIYLLLVPLILVYFVWGVVLLERYYRKTRSGIEKAQIRYVFTGVTLTLIPAIIANGILPALGNIQAILYGPNAVILLAIFMSIAIIKHSFLDIKLIVARSVAYTLLLVTVALIFAGLIITIPASVGGIGRPSLGLQIYYTLATFALAFGFQPLRKFFDRVTNDIFYQDAYNPQNFLDGLNQVLVSTIDLQILLHKSSEVIEQNMKSGFCAFAIRETSYSEDRVIGGAQSHLTQKQIYAVLEHTPDQEDKVYVTDYLADDQSALRNTLSQHKVAVLARLSSSMRSSEDIGYILLGAKKSGNPYNSQDTKMLEIISNELVIAIQNALRFEEIQNFNIKLAHEVEDATYRLRKTNEKLVALDQAKDEFISMASHQLRTPLTSVKGYLSMVLEGDAGKLNPKERKLLNQAFASSQRMVYLISDLLNLSRLKTGKFVIEANPVNLAEVIEGEVDQLIETAASHSLKLTYNKPQDFPTLMFDETKIRQVIMNFIDNAIHYTPAGGRIDVRLEDSAHSVEFTVTDSGIGVPKHEQLHLFTKFFRAGNAKKARPDGTGLGLYMAKKIIIAQGGSITFKSRENKGSTFGFVFPKAKLLPSEATAIDTTSKVHGHLHTPPQ
jgi:signal transduction histidine kinase